MTPAQVSRWVHSEFRGMHRTRLATLSAIVMGFLQSARLGVAAIGRGTTTQNTMSLDTPSGSILIPLEHSVATMRRSCVVSSGQ